jgi:hypothetical protein
MTMTMVSSGWSQSGSMGTLIGGSRTGGPGGTDKWKDRQTGGFASEGEKGMREYQWCGGAWVAAFCMLLAILFIITETKAMAAGPTDSSRNLFGEASRIVDNPARQTSFTLSQKFSLLEKGLPRYFDYREMAKRSLGETWNSLNPSQPEEFVKDFGSLPKASQARSLLMFNKGRGPTSRKFSRLNTPRCLWSSWPPTTRSRSVSGCLRKRRAG